MSATLTEPIAGAYRHAGLEREVAAELEISHAEAAALLVETTRFIALKAELEEPLTPSGPVDLLWHRFILRTRDYAEYCSGNFGEFVHHVVLDHDDEETRKHRYRRTRELLEARHGSLDSAFWPAAAVCGCR